VSSAETGIHSAGLEVVVLPLHESGAGGGYVPHSLKEQCLAYRNAMHALDSFPWITAETIQPPSSATAFTTKNEMRFGSVCTVRHYPDGKTPPLGGGGRWDV
jgi:hypothetical protein